MSPYRSIEAIDAGIPLQDIPGAEQVYNFGSATPRSCNFVYCDGSVHSVSYFIDGEVHRRLGNRRDGLAIDGKSVE